MSVPDPAGRPFEAWFAEKHRDALMVLYEHYLYAAHDDQPLAAYASHIDRLRAAGIEDVALQWLMDHAHLLHIAADGTLVSSSGERQSHPESQRAVVRMAECLWLSISRAAAARTQFNSTCCRTTLRPHEQPVTGRRQNAPPRWQHCQDAAVER